MPEPFRFEFGGMEMTRRQVFLAGLCLFLAACAGPAPEGPALPTGEARPVGVLVLEREVRSVSIQAVGRLEGAETWDPAFELSGRIDRIHASEGDRVEKGDVLASLDQEVFVRQLEVREAALAVARAEWRSASEAYAHASFQLEKSYRLYEAGGLSETAYETARVETSRLKELLEQATQGRASAEALLALAQKQLSQTELKAPGPGKVLAVHLQAGDPVQAGRPVFSLGGNRLIARVGISQKDIERIAPGATARCRIGDRMVDGRVDSIGESLDMVSLTYPVEILLESPAGRPGMTVSAVLSAETLEGIWIPVDAVLSDGKPYVLVVESGRVRKRPVIERETDRDRVLVEGLSEGDRLIVRNAFLVDEGQAVVISK